jgi:hypothetical protein
MPVGRIDVPVKVDETSFDNVWQVKYRSGQGKPWMRDGEPGSSRKTAELQPPRAADVLRGDPYKNKT